MPIIPLIYKTKVEQHGSDLIMRVPRKMLKLLGWTVRTKLVLRLLRMENDKPVFEIRRA